MKKRWQVIVAVLAAVVVVVALAFTWPRSSNEANTPLPSQSSVTGPSAATSPSPQPAESTQSREQLLADCKPLGEGFVPTRFTMEQPKADEKILSLGRDAENNIAAPPGDMPRTASWWNEGPQAGSDKGKVVLSIHTYRRGGALGNELYANETPLMDVGDVIKLYGDNGEVACYQFAEATKVWVEDYDEESDIMVDYKGDPRLLIIICSDQVAGQPAASRIFFYADPVSL